ncbi:class I SAM-dependent methyltransferase [Microbacterium protaetiae]|uniref:Class I SAM-dependent methyltransferase n=1 Tax=Microbacterium protaetiae TaxID=2509458 RepID=A0A4P6ECD4_9MICO|nr:class I SAM-dependent methyltransferase [Microbacterium protaetiae]QAY59003.1 class I SAM-dependent methyltransferase [Microbacterium protaetiae]
MQMSELTALLTPTGLSLLDTLDPVVSTADAARAVSRLRAAGHSPDLVSAVVGQAHLRAKAVAKFGDFAGRMLFTRAGLEQATRLTVAAHHASRMRTAGITRVADLGCGIGGDALAFAAAGLQVTAVDADEVTAAIAAYNLAVFGDTVTVRHGRAEASLPHDVDALWLDPARRAAGHRETRRVGPDDYSPPLGWAFEVAATLPTGIKLGPGHDRDALPADAETQWVSADGTVVELVVWTGALARDGVRRAALLLRGDKVHELTAADDAPDAEVRELGAYLHEPDGAVIRARLVGTLARQLEGGMLDPRIAYITGDAALTSPFVQSFRVRETMPAHAKTVSAALRARGIGTVEIKKRGMDVDPAAFRRKLALRGEGSATLILTRVGQRHLAVLADRVQ